MDWIQFAIFLITVGGTTVGLFMWSRAEHKEILNEIRSDQKSFQKEVKDFHGRLCTLEEKYMQMMQRILEGKK